MSDWADAYIQRLAAGETVTLHPRGNSMTPRIKSGQEVTVVPVASAVDVGDVVLCRVRGRAYLHIVTAIEGARFQIGNNHGRINGWIVAAAIFGRADL